MHGFNYPMRVLKKKMDAPDYKPFAVNCTTGQAIDLQSNKLDNIMYRLIQLLFVLTAVAFLYVILVQPVLATSQARDSVNQSLSALGGEDTRTLAKLRQSGEVVSEAVDNGLVTMVVNTDRSRLQENLQLAFALTTVREVYTDGKTIAITFVSSAE